MCIRRILDNMTYLPVKHMIIPLKRELCPYCVYFVVVSYIIEYCSILFHTGYVIICYFYYVIIMVFYQYCVLSEFIILLKESLN